jgi:hypothetical protein
VKRVQHGRVAVSCVVIVTMLTTLTGHHSYAPALTNLSMPMPAGYSLVSGMPACQIFKGPIMAGSLATHR